MDCDISQAVVNRYKMDLAGSQYMANDSKMGYEISQAMVNRCKKDCAAAQPGMNGCKIDYGASGGAAKTYKMGFRPAEWTGKPCKGELSRVKEMATSCKSRLDGPQYVENFYKMHLDSSK